MKKNRINSKGSILIEFVGVMSIYVLASFLVIKFVEPSHIGSFIEAFNYEVQND